MSKNNQRLELLLGCGHRREKLLGPPGSVQDPRGDLQWSGLVTLDINEHTRPDILCDLNEYKGPGRWVPIDWYKRPKQPCDIRELLEDCDWGHQFKENLFDEVHAYEVVEHLGQQGDARAFFAFFSEVWRILKPGGHLFTTSPSRYSPWLWGDPSHRRVFIPESTVFLSQDEYKKQLDGDIKTPMSDFRSIYRADFDVHHKVDNQRTFVCHMQAVKPSRFFVDKK